MEKKIHHIKNYAFGLTGNIGRNKDTIGQISDSSINSSKFTNLIFNYIKLDQILVHITLCVS
jgi:hypothetical protein